MATKEEETTNTEGSDGNTTTVTETKVETEEKNFTQAEVDAIIAKRLKKFADFDAMKDKASKFDELEKEKLGEVERLQKERDEWKGKTEELTEKHKNVLIRSEVIAEASKAGANNPKSIFALLDKSALEVDEDGNVSGVADAIAALKKSDDYLFGTKTQRMGDANGGVQSGGNTTPGTFTRTEIRDPKFYQEHEKEILAAMKAGRITDE